MNAKSMLFAILTALALHTAAEAQGGLRAQTPVGRSNTPLGERPPTLDGWGEELANNPLPPERMGCSDRTCGNEIVQPESHSFLASPQGKGVMGALILAIMWLLQSGSRPGVPRQ
jgi:hypothetical protein